MKLRVAIVFGTQLATLSGCPGDDCQTDKDCKGDRVCNFGTCEDPQAGASGPTPVDTGSGSTCRSFQSGVGPAGYPQHLYSAAGPIVVQEMSNVDSFWAARTQAVVYGPDQPNVMNNAYSESDGYIYFDPNFVAQLDAQTYSYAPSQMVFAHEFGHQIQLTYHTFHNDNLQDELGADCYAGFFVAWLACRNAISNTDIMNDFSTMCALGNSGQQLPWWATGSHGDCQQRTSAFQTGAQAYQNGVAPLNGCTF